MAGKDFYKVLGVEKNASQDDVKKAFRDLAHKHHPDKAGGDATKFKEINEAYQVLGNAEKRKQYDQFGSGAFDGSGGFGGNPFGGGFGGFGQGGFENINVDMGDLGDIFGSMFGFGGGRAGGRREAQGADIEIDLELTFEEAAFGTEKEISLRKHVRCERCAGGGVEPGSKMTSCKTCNGQGQVRTAQRTMFGMMQSVRECADCQGRGQVPEKACTTCKGSGVVREERIMRVKIPAGVSEGGVLKIAGEGEAGPHGARAGALYIELHVKPHKEFEREGNMVLSERIIGFTQAALGDDIKVNTIHGEVDLKIPAGTQSGTEFKLRGKGIQGADHIVTIVVEVPTKLSREERKLIEELDLRK